MWLKFFVCLLVVAFCVGISYLFGAKYRKQREYYGQFLRFHERFLGELNYLHRPVVELVSGGGFSGEFECVLQDFLQKKSPQRAYFLSDEEYRFVVEYFSQIGKGDSSSQQQFYSAQTAQIKQKSEFYSKIAKEKGDLALKLGLLGGLAIVILII